MWLRYLHESIPLTTLLVTHDQQEAMEVADHLAIIHDGRLEQRGDPADLYDHPANAFVMQFLGPTTRFDGAWVRPHDLVVHRRAGAGALAGVVERVTHLGFEVRVDVRMEGSGPVWVQLPRATAADLGLAPGERVWVSGNGRRDGGRVDAEPNDAVRGDGADEVRLH